MAIHSNFYFFKEFLISDSQRCRFMFVFRNQFKIYPCGPHDQSIFASLLYKIFTLFLVWRSGDCAQAEPGFKSNWRLFSLVSCCDIIGQLNAGLAEWFKSWQGHPYRVGIVCPSWLEWGNKKVGAKRWLGLILVVPLCSAWPEI